MAERSGINLLPDEGRDVEHQRERRNLLTLVSIGIVSTSIGLWILAAGYGFLLNNLNSGSLSTISADTTQLTALKSIEVPDRSLNTKLLRLQSLLATYPHYSVLLANVAAFTPSGIKLTGVQYDTSNKVTLTGLATGASSFGEFVNVLRDPNQGGTKFTSVDFSSLSGGGKTGQYSFTITMTPKGSF